MFVPIRIIIRQCFPQLLLSTNAEENLLIWMLMWFLKKVCFYHPFWYEERQERGNHEPLVSLRRLGSAEQAQFLSVFFLVKRRQARGERESESRARGGVKNKTTKKRLYPYAHQDSKTTKNILRIMNGWEVMIRIQIFFKKCQNH